MGLCFVTVFRRKRTQIIHMHPVSIGTISVRGEDQILSDEKKMAS